MLVELKIVGITYNQIESGVYALILENVEGTRRIPIIIGAPEAQAIECKLQGVQVPRPLTHDLMIGTLEAFGIELTRVEIRRLPNGVFAADLYLTDGIRQNKVDSRSSDAVALAIRAGAPIFTSQEVLDETGFDTAGDQRQPRRRQSEENATHDDTPLEEMTDSELKTLMQRAVEKEDYETASEIKRILESRR